MIGKDHSLRMARLYAELRQRNGAMMEAEPTLLRIAREVIAKHAITLLELRARRRNAFFVLARQEFYFRAMTETLCSLTQIARFVGGRDHSTLMHAISRYCVAHGLPMPRGAQWKVKSGHRGPRAYAAFHVPPGQGRHWLTLQKKLGTADAMALVNREAGL